MLALRAAVLRLEDKQYEVNLGRQFIPCLFTSLFSQILQGNPRENLCGRPYLTSSKIFLKRFFRRCPIFGRFQRISPTENTKR